MFSKLHKTFKPHHMLTIYKNIEDIRIARIILKTIFGLIAAFLMVICLAYFSGDMTLSIIILVSGFTLVIPIFLLFRGHLRLSSIVLLLIVVVMMTLSASQGQVPAMYELKKLAKRSHHKFAASIIIRGITHRAKMSPSAAKEIMIHFLLFFPNACFTEGSLGVSILKP